MLASALLLGTLALAPAQDPPRLQGIALNRGQELVYLGTVEEESRSPAGVSARAYALEARVFILETGSPSSEIALFTHVRLSESPPGAIGSARLEFAEIDRRGRMTLTATGLPPLAALEGVPVLEPAGFLELPAAPISVGSAWDVADGLRPPRAWRVEDVAFEQGQRCLTLVGEQVSADWEYPTARGAAWKRTDRLALSLQTGWVLRLERVVEMRGGTARQSSTRTRTSYRLRDNFIYPDRLALDRRRELQRTWQLHQALAELQSRPARARAQAYETLQAQIETHLNSLPGTPYRPATLALQRRVEASARGEIPPRTDSPELPPAPPRVGDPAADFVAEDLTTRQPMRLRHWRGQPVMLVFVRSDSSQTRQGLQLARDLHARGGGRTRVAIVALGSEDNVVAWARALEVPGPILSGRELAAIYAIDAPLRLVGIDAQGLISHVSDGGDASVRARAALEPAPRR